MKQSEINIKTFAGLEEVLAKEVIELGGTDVETKTRMVSCTGDLGFVYKLNYSLSTALRVLVPVYSFRAINEHHLYRNLKRFQWDEHMSLNTTFKIDSTVFSEYFTHSQFCALKCKDALVDFFRKNYNQERPSVEKDEADVVWNLHIDGDWVTLSLDSSGSSLHKRGYRTATGAAPLNEVMAAGILEISGWDGKGNLLDPMCGSGTILIEAAFKAVNMPPQIHREYFAFKNWKNFDPELWIQIQQSRIERMSDFSDKIIGSDMDSESIACAKENIRNADLEDYIQLEQKDFFASEKSISPLQIVCNPPYNKRLEIKNKNFYKEIGDTLKQHYPNCLSWFLTGDPAFSKNIGLRPSKKIRLLNAKIESQLLRYETYEGTKKSKKE